MVNNTLLKWGVIGGILLVLFLPLFVANSLFFPFITGKAFAFRIIVELTAGLWVVWSLTEVSVRPKRSLILYAAGAFALSLLVSVFLSVNPDKSFWSNFERMEGWVGIAHVILYFVILLSVFTTEKLWRWFWNTAIAVSVLEGLFGLGQLFGWFTINQGGVRVDGTFGNATYLSIYMLFSFFMTLLALYWWGRERRRRFYAAAYGFAALIQLVMIFYAATRGTLLGLAGGLLIAGLVIAFARRESKIVRQWGISVLVVFAVLVGGFYAVEQTPFVQQHEVLSRLASIDTPQKLVAEGSTRFAIWNMAWEGFLARPVFGWGQESFNYLFNEYYRASLYNQEPWFDRAHNEFLDWLVAGGAAGLLLWLSLFGIGLYYLWRKGNAFDPVERGLLTGLLAGYACHDLFVFDNLVSYLYFFSILAFIAWRARAGTALGGVFSEKVSQGSVTVAAPLIAIVSVCVVYAVNIPGLSAATALIQSLSPQQAGVTKNLEYFKKAVADTGVSGLGAQEVHEQLLQFGGQVQSLGAGNPTFQSEVATYATSEVGKFAKTVPNDARVKLFYGTYLLQTGNTAAARTELEAAHRLSPEKQQILFALAALEGAVGDGTAALTDVKQAYELAPTYDEARIQYAAIALRTGNPTLASALLMERFGTLVVDSDVLLGAYLATKDYTHALAILKNRVDANPNNYQLHVNLAAGYLDAGNPASAIAELQTAIKVEPAFASQGQAIISQIQSGQLR